MNSEYIKLKSILTNYSEELKINQLQFNLDYLKDYELMELLQLAYYRIYYKFNPSIGINYEKDIEIGKEMGLIKALEV